MVKLKIQWQYLSLFYQSHLPFLTSVGIKIKWFQSEGKAYLNTGINWLKNLTEGPGMIEKES